MRPFLLKLTAAFWKQLDADKLFDGSAVLAFYFIISLFPGMLLLLSAVSFLPTENFSDESTLWWVSYLPESMANTLQKFLADTGGRRFAGTLSLSLLAGLWTAGSGLAAVIRLLNGFYGVEETRGYFKVRLIATALTVVIGSLFVAPVVLFSIDRFKTFFEASGPFRFFALGLNLFLIFSMIYYWGPNIKQKFRMTIPGSVCSTVMLVIISVAFEWYVRQYGHYDLVYGGLTAAVILLLWLYLLGFFILVGGLVNRAFRAAQDKKYES